MAPVAIAQSSPLDNVESLKASLAAAKPALDSTPLRTFDHHDVTPVIGTEFLSHGTNHLTIATVLADDAKLAALAKLVSERGVVFFRDSKITPEEQKVLVTKLGQLSGKPSTSGLHVHPLTLPGQPEGDEISVISNQYTFSDKFKFDERLHYAQRPGREFWHSDITFENVPSDYASLVIRKLPTVGGDTLWASAYEAYDRLSPTLQKFLETLTAVHVGEQFIQLANKANATLREPRGAPENVGQDLTTVHPVIRTNPVTGWKGLFVNKVFTKRIVELSEIESDNLLAFLYDVVATNHTLQVRFKWEENSLAIWDNRSTFHAATPDIAEVREGTRSVSLGERPYFDPNSQSRRAALAKVAGEA